MPELGVVISSPLPAAMELPSVARLARQAEDAGLDCIWAEDVLYRGDAVVLDVACVLSACAAATDTIGIGSAIFVPSMRNHAWALKQVATMNLLARGRFTLGVALGSADAEEYHLAGATRAGRRERTEEFLAVLAAWARPEGAGSTLVTDPARALLIGAGQPAPALWVGGTSPAALQRAARFGDGWLSGLQTPAEFRESLAQLGRLAEEHGRPVPRAGIVLTVAVGTRPGDLRGLSAAAMSSLYGTPSGRAAELAIGGTPEQVAAQLAPYFDAGAEKIALVSAALPWMEAWPLLGQARRILFAGS